MRGAFARSTLIIALLLAGAAAASAQGIRVTADRTEATLDERIVLTVTVEGAKDVTPDLPELTGFDVAAAGSQTRMSFVNGRRSSSVSYSFILTPRELGSFRIGPASIEVDGEIYSSAPFEVKIVEASARPREQRDLFVTARVSTTTPFVGQQVVHVWRFYRRVQVADARLEQPTFEGFQVEELGEVREYQAAVRGQQYLVSELRRAIFPQETGELTIEPGRLTVEALVAQQGRRRGLLDDFFSPRDTERRVLRESPITLDVRPLPSPPPGFSGLVGDFDITARASRQELRVGESSTLKVTIQGVGNPLMIAEPRLPPLPRFKIYDDQPTSSIDRSGNALKGSKSFSKALVPLDAGEQRLPPLELSFFDPEGEAFEVARTEPIVLRVLPAEGDEELGLTESLDPAAGKVSVRIMADDILPLYKELGAVRPAALGGRQWALIPGLLTPPALFFALAFAQRRRRRFERDGNLLRRRTALKRARARLEEASAADDVSRCLRQLVGDKLGLEGSALTPREVGEALRSAPVPEALADETVGLLRRLEAAKYGAAPIGLGEAKAALEPLLVRLDREIGA